MSLTHEQVTQLLKAINPLRVSKKEGQSHLEAYEIRAHLNRIFGFAGWSETQLDLTMLYEQSKEEGGQSRWRAGYRATMRLTIHGDPDAVYDGSAVGTNWGYLPDSKRDEAHDMAIKTAESQALKRAAINLGDQFGLSLYAKGSTGALVGRTLVMPPATVAQKDAAAEVSVDSHVTEPVAPEQEVAAEPVTDWPTIIRNRVINEAPTKTGQARKSFLGRQLIEAGTKGIATATVTDAAGNGMSLETLIGNALKDAA